MLDKLQEISGCPSMRCDLGVSTDALSSVYALTIIAGAIGEWNY